tara:strand:- start:1128 stop:2303 length:1176 start_codon:yes stop_codon:yes gene_type:complete
MKINMRIKIILVCITFVSYIQGQEYHELLDKKEKLIKESNFLNTVLAETQSSQQYTLESLIILNTKISVQEKLLEVLTKEFKILQTQEKEIEGNLNSLIKELDLLKKNYSTLIILTHKSLRSYNKLLFFLSATSFNQLVRRLYHFRQLEVNRRNKYVEIESLQKQVVEKKKLILQKKAKQSDLTFAKNTKLENLKKSKNIKEKTIKVLKNKEDSIMKAIKLKEFQTNKITEEILSILEKKANKSDNLTPELKLISNNFSSNKGRLPWPVLTGSIVSKFGKIPHPVLSGITIMNNGIEISTNNNKVRSVFNGEVSKIIVLPTGLKVVIIRHGDYLTVYSNLYLVNVNVGQQIQTKQNIGELYRNTTRESNILGFQIWQDRQKLNPSNWISHH